MDRNFKTIDAVDELSRLLQEHIDQEIIKSIKEWAKNNSPRKLRNKQYNTKKPKIRKICQHLKQKHLNN